MRPPKYLRNGTNKLERTKYGSYVDPKEYGMAQQKNARSLGQAMKSGYKVVTKEKYDE